MSKINPGAEGVQNHEKIFDNFSASYAHCKWSYLVSQRL